MTSNAPAKPWYRQMETIVGMSALAVSFIAVFIAVYSAIIDRDYARASVWPYLEVGHSNSDGVFLHVENVGVGPARIKYVTFEYDGKYYSTWGQLLRALNKDENASMIQSTISGRTIPGQRAIKPITTEHSGFHDMIYGSREKSYEMSICYCSIYDDCWLLNGEGVNPIEECVIDEDKKFRQ